MLDLPALKKAAQAASPGVTRVLSHTFKSVGHAAKQWAKAITNQPGTTTYCVWFEGTNEVRALTGNGPMAEVNANYIAAASPDIILELISLVEERRWQPIETAPVGEWVLVADRVQPFCAIAEVGMGRLLYDDWFRMGHGVWRSPTHWMHLPAPPKGDE